MSFYASDQDLYLFPQVFHTVQTGCTTMLECTWRAIMLMMSGVCYRAPPPPLAVTPPPQGEALQSTPWTSFTPCSPATLLQNSIRILLKAAPCIRTPHRRYAKIESEYSSTQLKIGRGATFYYKRSC